MLLSGSCFAFALQGGFLGFDVSYSCCVVWGRRALLDSWLFAISPCSCVSQSIDMDGVISLLNFVFFSQLHIFCYFWFNLFVFLAPRTGSCVCALRCALVVEHAIAYPNGTVQYPSLIRASDCWSTYTLLYSLPWRRAGNAVCPVELDLIPSSLAMPFCLYTSLPRCAIFH